MCEQCNVHLTIQHIVLHGQKFSQSRPILNNPTTMEAALWEHNTHLIYFSHLLQIKWNQLKI